MGRTPSLVALRVERSHGSTPPNTLLSTPYLTLGGRIIRTDEPKPQRTRGRQLVQRKPRHERVNPQPTPATPPQTIPPEPPQRTPPPNVQRKGVLLAQF